MNSGFILSVCLVAFLASETHGQQPEITGGLENQEVNSAEVNEDGGNSTSLTNQTTGQSLLSSTIANDVITNDTPLTSESTNGNESSSTDEKTTTTPDEGGVNYTTETSATTEETSGDSSEPHNPTVTVTTVIIDTPCDPNPCLNGGLCVATADGLYECTCPVGFVGGRCQTQDFCVEDEAGKLCGNGACAHSEDMSSRYCKCFSGRHWDLEQKECREAQPPCFPNPCLNGGTCRAAVSSGMHQCTCSDEYTGLFCEIVNECSREEETGKLCGNGDCVLEPSGRKKFCACADGFFANAETHLCQAVAPPCEPNPCNGRECQSEPNGDYSCGCNSTLYGRNCEVKNRCSDAEDSLVCNNGRCVLSQDKVSWQCLCAKGFVKDSASGKCKKLAKPCHPNPCANDGTCTAISAQKYNCTCTEGFIGNRCTVRDRCALDGGSAFCGEADCFTDGTRNTIYCACGKGQHFDYGTRRCVALDLCPLITCQKHEECADNTCGCKTGFKRNNVTNECEADFCTTKGCPDESMQCEENPRSPVDVLCSCRDGEAFDGTKCTAAACLFPSLNKCEQRCEQQDSGYDCLCHPNFSLKADNVSCGFSGESQCKNRTCGMGTCILEDETEVCACAPGYTEEDGKCVDLCSAGKLPEGLCPEGACFADKDKGFKCVCKGKYKYAADGVTCTARSMCSQGESGWSACEKKHAKCIEDWNTKEGFDCACAPGFEESGGICKKICDIDENRQKCFLRAAECSLDENHAFTCHCPPGFTTDANGVCNKLASLSSMLTLPLDVSTYEVRTGTGNARMLRLPTETDVDYTLVQTHIQESMKQLFGGFVLANVLNCKNQKDYILCKVEVQLTYLSEEENFNRLLMTSSCAYNETISSNLCLIPPSLVLRRDKIPSDVSFQETDACDVDVKSELCEPETSCESFSGGFTCKCKPGYRERKKYFPVKDDAATFTESCSDVDECAEAEPCPPTSLCTNVVGSYRCSCMPGYRTSNESASGCVELCSPNPCLHGECTPSTQYTFECRCEPGYAGALCNYEDKNYKSARVNTIIVGVVLGGIFLVTVILFFASISRLRKKKFSDDPTHVLYSTEMLERRPVRLSAANPAFERD